MKPEVNEQTYVCPVVFLDIAQFSQQSKTTQSAWRVELAALLGRGLKGMNPEHRLLVDSGDGAAMAFLLHPEEPLPFARYGAVVAFLFHAEEALSFVRYLAGELPKLRHFALRVGAHVGPLRVVRGIGGRLNPIGDDIGAVRRVMDSAGINELLVSRAFFEAAIKLWPGNSSLFSPCHKQAGKDGREPELYRVVHQKAPATPGIWTTITAPPRTGRLSGFGVKAGIGLAATLVAGIGLGIVLGNREPGRTAPPPPPLAQPAAPEIATPAAAPAKPAHPEQARPVRPERQRSTAAASGKVAAANGEPHSGSAYCPDCSCTDLMTKLSLGVPLEKKEQRYLDERCRK